jgi:hypothetical protein
VATGVSAAGATASVAVVLGVGVALALGLGTTRTTGGVELLVTGVGAGRSGADASAGVRGCAGGVGVPEFPSPTARAMPAEPTSATAPTSTTGPWRRGALCLPIRPVFHRTGPRPGRGSMGE